MGTDDQDDQPSSSDLESFQARVSAAQETHRDKHEDGPSNTQGLAVRLSSDFIAGILVGGLLGWGVDRTFGTEPFGLIICLGLGFVTAVRLAMRSAEEINRRAQEAADD